MKRGGERVIPVKSIILSVLGLLTPQDLKRLTKHTKQELKLKQAAGGEFEPLSVSETELVDSQDARVLHFPSPEDSHREASREFTSRPSSLEAIGVLSAEKQAEIQKAAKEAYEKSQPDTLDFILSERDRFKTSEDKIHKQVGLSCYKKNADMRLFQVVSKDSEGNKKRKVASVLGILIDKKQN